MNRCPACGSSIKSAPTYWSPATIFECDSKRDYEKFRQSIICINREVAWLRARADALAAALELIKIQYLGCGGNLTPSEILESITAIATKALTDYRN